MSFIFLKFDLAIYILMMPAFISSNKFNENNVRLSSPAKIFTIRKRL